MPKSASLIEGELKWLRQLRLSTFAVVCIAVGALVTQVTPIIEGLSRLYDRYLKEPEAFVLADVSAKSAFSDQLAQCAWRRLFWASNFRARVVNEAPLADIDASWKAYIDADAEWNANLMIAIVGLDRFYDTKRSIHLEGTVQSLFAALDDELAALRNSGVIKALRESRNPSDQEKESARLLSERVKAPSEKVNFELYALARCITPPRESTPQDKKNLCR